MKDLDHIGHMFSIVSNSPAGCRWRPEVGCYSGRWSHK